MNKVLSFIIPSYNVEKYLQKCLESFFVPDVLEKIEVIVVDDGSKDRTAEIASSYAEQYPDTYRLLKKENGGHGSTINEGSKIARGKYFKVIDADDWIVSENLQPFVYFLEGCTADAVLTPFHMVEMNTGIKTLQRMYINNYSHLYTPEEISNDWKSFDKCTVFHGITYCTEFYRKHNHRLPEKVFYEDQEYSTVPFCHAQNVAVLNLIIYQYLIGNSTQSVAAQNQVKRIKQLETVILHIIDYWAKHKKDTDFSEAYWLQKTTAAVLSYYWIMCILNPDKADGRRACKHLNKVIKKRCPILYRNVYKKYAAYELFRTLHISNEQYDRIIHSAAFRIIRHNHKIEKD